MVGEEVERPAFSGVRAHERPVLPLVEERPGLLAGVGRRKIADAVLLHRYQLGHGPERGHDLEREPLVAADGSVVAEQDPFRAKRRSDPGDDVVPHALEPSGEQLRHHVGAIPVHDERGQAISFGVHDAITGRVEPRAPRGGGSDAPAPPAGIDGLPAVRKQPQPDLGFG